MNINTTFLNLIEELSDDEAHNIFNKHGVNSRGKSPEELSKSYRSLVFKIHPDRGGSLKDTKDVNAAWDRLKKGSSSGGSERKSYPSEHHRPRGSVSTPEWAWAGYSGGLPPSSHIYNNDYRDLNFIKKRMWELSGKSKEEHTVHQFDGNYFRNTFTAYGNSNIHHHMAKAMLKWGAHGNPYNTKAIFVSKKSDPKKLHLVWANGKHVEPGVHIEHNSFNNNPSNDQEFTKNLSSWIDSKVPKN
jgi:hypothetical protein